VLRWQKWECSTLTGQHVKVRSVFLALLHHPGSDHMRAEKDTFLLSLYLPFPQKYLQDRARDRILP